MIQIDMEMPKCCDECFALDDHGDYPFCLISQDQRGYTFNTKEKRMPTCPLKAQEPVKPRVGHDGWYRCGGCNNPLASDERVKHFYGHQWPKYCEECGRAVKWE